METRLYLTLAILAFNLNVSLADDAPEISLNKPVINTQINLTPSTPVVADFSDLVPESAPSAVSLVPVTPKEAGFDDEPAIEQKNDLLNILSPSTPKEADFEDNITPENDDLSLTPTTPDEAGFEETF